MSLMSEGDTHVIRHSAGEEKKNQKSRDANYTKGTGGDNLSPTSTATPRALYLSPRPHLCPPPPHPSSLAHSFPPSPQHATWSPYTPENSGDRAPLPWFTALPLLEIWHRWLESALGVVNVAERLPPPCFLSACTACAMRFLVPKKIPGSRSNKRPGSVVGHVSAEWRGGP
ncbi:uncharacterized protein B0I36DRAFT_122435 [Microdochium trichocladiopsis]|uniref:Uncharacterized protein n=1 Tax=Microdochium trichocladiopsis TaxID=1682393 RepID=A0A9P8Y9Z2_9PEZI|nr:uncharacterized protein B0I36DRAFT_122435 [Microdochium trichocladiopsis]KAH7031395.1 hypothetical protein B0I36DRAFT_122435 [Microdochium trichocladiopsis]